MLFPILKRTKYRKSYTTNKRVRKIKDKLLFGTCGLIANESSYVTPNELESIRRVAVRVFRLSFFKNLKPKLFIRIYPYLSLTKKPTEVRMGKGKGSHDKWVYPVIRGKILLEISNLPFIYSKQLLKSFSAKFSVKNNIVIK